jgi:uncharacterized membrane protein YdjX (TVP38/TMEM64 family)
VIQKIKENIRELGHLTPLALISTFMPIVGSSLLIVFLIPIGHWLRENWEIGTLVFLAGAVFFCGLALLPTNVIGILSGWAFSFELGLLVLLTGVIGASIISFFINSRLSGERLPEALRKHPRSAAVYHSLLQDDLKKTMLIITLLRMSVVMPFAFTNFLLAASRVPLPAFIVGTAAGMLPRSASMAFVGSGLAELNLESTRDIYIFVLGAIASIVSMIAIAVISRKALERLTRSDGSTETRPVID